MTVKKAIQVLDWMIQKEIKLAKGFEDSGKPWNSDFDCLRDLATTLSETKKNDILTLNVIRRELVPKCKHPEKLHDKDSDGNLYCMGCNLDL